MCEGNFTGRGIDIAAQQTGVTGSVMRRTERSLCDERLTGFQQANDTVNLGGFQRFVERERW